MIGQKKNQFMQPCRKDTVIEGIDVVDKIAVVPTTRRNNMGDVPVDVITITSVSVVSQ